MLCRHNDWVQGFGKVRDADEIARREKIWAAFIVRVQQKTGRKAAEIPPTDFRRLVARTLDVMAFELKTEVDEGRHGADERVEPVLLSIDRAPDAGAVLVPVVIVQP